MNHILKDLTLDKDSGKRPEQVHFVSVSFRNLSVKEKEGVWVCTHGTSQGGSKSGRTPRPTAQWSQIFRINDLRLMICFDGNSVPIKPSWFSVSGTTFSLHSLCFLICLFQLSTGVFIHNTYLCSREFISIIIQQREQNLTRKKK